MIDPEFINTYEEKHAVWFGFTDGIAFVHNPVDYQESITEPHYYRLGFLIGNLFKAAFWFVLGALATKLILMVI